MDFSVIWNLVQEAGPAIRRLAIRREVDPDIVSSEVLAVCWKRRELLAKSTNPAGWIYGCAKNVCREVSRKNRRHPGTLPDAYDHPDSSLSPDLHVQKVELTSLVRKAVNHLRNHYRDVISACDLGGEAIQEFADRVGCPVETCRTWRKRARRQLAECASLRSYQ